MPLNDPTHSDPAEEDQASIADLAKAITPRLILIGVVTGVTFAIGSALVNRYLFKAGR